MDVKKGMTIKQIQYFVEVENLGSFTRASETLFITQPGLSYSIKQLENELGVSLFERNGTSLALTRYGKAFLPHAKRILQEISEAEQAISDLTGKKEPDHLNIAYIGTFANTLVPQILTEFYEQEQTSLSVQLYPYHSYRELFDEYHKGTVNVIFYYTKPDKAQSCLVARQELVLVVPHGHRFEGRESVPIRELKGEPMCFSIEGSNLYTHTMKMFTHEKIMPNITMCTSEWPSMITHVALKQCLCIVPEFTTVNRADVSVCRLDSPLRFRDIYMSMSNDTYQSSKAARQYYSFCERYFESHNL